MSEGEEVVTEPVESEHIAELPEVPEVIPTIVKGKKTKKAEVQKLADAEPPEAPVKPEVEKPKPKPRARKTTKPPPPTPAPTPEPIPEPITPAPKKAVRIKKAAPVETTLEPFAEEPVSSKKLLSDLNDFSARIQELHRMNEQRRKNVYRELIGGMV